MKDGWMSSCVFVSFSKQCWLFQSALGRLIILPDAFSKHLEVWHDWQSYIQAGILSRKYILVRYHFLFKLVPYILS